MSYKPRIFSRLLFYLICFAVTSAFGQAPTITHVDKYVNGNGQRVTISGSNFGGNPANLVVWFGAAMGDIETATDQTIEVAVPPGTTYESIVVTNTATGKSASSKGEFLLSFGGDQPIALANLSAQADLAAENGLYDVCLCDLDRDGKNDVAASNSGSLTAPPSGVTLYRNTTASAGAAFTFSTKTSFLTSTKTLNIKCGDLNGDGKKDLVISEADPGNRVFILKNGSTPGSFVFTPQNIPLAGKSPKRVDIADLDFDGLPELIITDQNTENKDLLILPNTSAGGAISFGPHTTISFPASGNSGSDGLAIQDMDNDNKPDLIVSQVLSSTGNVYVYKNESRTGTFIFNKITKADIAPTTPTNTGAPINVRVGDIDGDSKPDIAVTHFLGSRISVLLNQSTATSMQFAAPVAVATDPFPFGLDLGDLDGDGKLDIAVASLTGPVTEANPKSLTILSNTSTPGNVSFLPRLTQATTFINRHIVIGDIDGDSKPDITYTSVDDNTRGVPASKISFFRNTSCIKPVVTPGGPLVVCTGFPIALEGTISPGAVYQWKQDGANVGTPTSSFTPSLAGNYTLDITSDGCTKTSNSVNVTMGAGAVTGLSVNSNSPICVDGTINLTASSTGGTEYNWTGPAGFSATGATVPRASYKPEFAGRYEVEVKAGACIAAKGYTLVETISLPAFTVNFTGSDVFCAPDTKLLTASPNDANFNYQWADGNGDIGGATASSHTVSATGSYSFTATSTLYPGCPEIQSDAVSVTLATRPVVNFQAPAETCKDTPVTFTNTSAVQENANPVYKWEFGDAATSTEKNPVHTYIALANRTVKLTVAYRGNACPEFKTQSIDVVAPPTATITAPGNIFKFCEGDKLTLSVSPAFSEYLWSTNATTPTLDVTTGGNFSVQLKNAVGCQISVNKDVVMMPKPAVTASAEPGEINIGDSAELSASGNFTSYLWSPAESLDSPEGPSPKATPQITTVYTVEVTNSDGCVGEATVEVKVNVDNPLNLLTPANFFSPNADDINPTWNVKNIDKFNCSVIIYDEKGLKVYEANSYKNDWDGTNNGKRLPDGVYYYMIRCDGDSGQKTGSITILR